MNGIPLLLHPSNIDLRDLVNMVKKTKLCKYSNSTMLNPMVSTFFLFNEPFGSYQLAI